jgi:hypothetical protein
MVKIPTDIAVNINVSTMGQVAMLTPGPFSNLLCNSFCLKAFSKAAWYQKLAQVPISQ